MKLARISVPLALCTAVMAGFVLPAHSQELRLSTFVPPSHVIAREIITPWTQDVAKATNGQRQLSIKATEVYLKRSAEGVESVRGKAEVIRFSPDEQKKVNATLRPIIDDWIKESESKGIPARDMLRKIGYPGAK